MIAKYKVICFPPEGYGEKHEILCETYKDAKNIVDWYINVEWENYSASAQIVLIKSALEL